MGSMSADALELPIVPKPDVWKQDDMRVVCMYQINRDTFVVRFDTIIDGEQYNVGYEAGMPALHERATTADQFARDCVPLALDAFRNGKAMKSRQLWIAESTECALKT